MNTRLAALDGPLIEPSVTCRTNRQQSRNSIRCQVFRRRQCCCYRRSPELGNRPQIVLRAHSVALECLFEIMRNTLWSTEYDLGEMLRPLSAHVLIQNLISCDSVAITC